MSKAMTLVILPLDFSFFFFNLKTCPWQMKPKLYECCVSEEFFSLCSKKPKPHQSTPPQQKPLTLAYDGDFDM